MRYCGDLAVGLHDRATGSTPSRCDDCIGLGSSAVEGQNAARHILAKDMIYSINQGGAPFPRRHDGQAMTELGFGNCS